MEAESAPPSSHHDRVPTQFVVELKQGEYAICERVMLVGPDAQLPVDLIESYLERYKLRAAPLPGGSGRGGKDSGPLPPGLHEAFFSIQTGRAPLVNVNVYGKAEISDKA